MSGAWGNTANGKVSGSTSGGQAGWGNTAKGKVDQPVSSGTKHHGFSFGHLLAQTGSDLYDTAVHSPSGLYQVGKAVTQDSSALSARFTHALGLKTSAYDEEQLKKDPALFGNTRHVAKAIAEGYIEDAKHPLRHPGNTLLDVASVLSLGAGTAARAGGVARVLKGTEEGGVLRAALKGPRPITRTLKYNNKDIQAGQYSRSALKRATERLHDKFSERFPDVKLAPGVRNLHQRVGHELSQNRKITEAIAKAPAAALAKVRLSRPELKAVQVVAEGVPIDKRIAFHERQLESFKPGQTKLIAATKKEISLLRGARRHVSEIDGVPKVDPHNHKLVDFYQQAHALAHDREALLGNTPKLVREDGKVVRKQSLTDEQIAGRLTAPAHVLGHVVPAENVPNLFRFPYKAEQSKAAIFKAQGYKGGIPKTPGTLTHGFDANLLKAGVARNDTGKLVSESYLEAHRFAAVMKHRDQFLKLAHDSKESENDIPIRTDALLNKAWPKVIQDISEKPELSKGDLKVLDTHYEDLRTHLFPSAAEGERLLAEGKHADVKWIDKDALGGLNEANPSVAASTRRAVNVFDNINNASRAAILYLKPAYAVPNIIGNAALNIVQQGWGAPAQVARSVRLFHKLDKPTYMKLKLAMGEGISGSLETERGIGTRAINKMAHLWQKPVDTPFRVNAFFYEARRAGYTTPAQIKALLNDEGKLLPIAREANKAIIDYGDLNPFEQSVVRRAIFFYPWVKGSTRYAGRFLTENSGQAAFLGQEGKIGAAQDKKDLGNLPSYAEGLFKVGQRGDNPLTINPTSAGILQTPAQLGKALAEIRSNHPGEAFTLAQNFTPALAAVLAAVGASPRRKGQSEFGAAKEQLVGGLPALTTAQQLLHPPSESKKARLYPRNREDVLLHFLFGGLAKTPLNKAKAQQAKYLEDHPR